jgi:DNA gyrase subunit A
MAVKKRTTVSKSKLYKKSDKKEADYNKGIVDKNISSECKNYMRIFGSNNNIMRHLPGVYDGLKLGERRILYTMYESGYHHNKPFKKVASITGKVLDYHPHGEIPVNGTIVRMAQPWNNIQCCIEGSGNFGTVGGAPAGASRYIEARLSKYAYYCFFKDFSPHIVDMKLNYSGDKYEPEYLPSRYPNTLINNTFGVGYGIATSICTYNLKEVIEMTMRLINDPDIKDEDCILVPDSPTGASIVDDGMFPHLCKTGRGKFRMRGVIDIEEEDNCLVIRNTPLQSFWDKSIKKAVFKLLMDGKVNYMTKFSDDTDGDNMCYRIYLKPEIDPENIRNLIYEKTPMESSFSVNFKLIEDYAYGDYNIKTVLTTWIDFRRETKRRYFNHKLAKSTERQHILQTLLFILNDDNAEKTMTIFKKSLNKKDIIDKLMKTYKISSLQADVLSELKGYQYSKEAREKYIAEKKEIDKTVDELNKIVRSQKKIDKIILEELQEGIDLFGEERKSAIVKVDNTKLILDTEHIVVFTKKGYVKKLPLDVSNIGFIEKGDLPTHVIVCNNRDDLLIFDELGKVNRLPVHEIRGSVITDTGRKLNEYCNVYVEVKSVMIKPTEENLKDKSESEYFYLLISKNGQIKKTYLSKYKTVKNELICMGLKDDDRLEYVELLKKDEDILVFTDKGNGLCFNTSEVKETGRTSLGVKSMEMMNDEHIIGINIRKKKDKFIFVLTEKGNVKKCTLDNLPLMSRNMKPLKLTTISKGDSISCIRSIKGNEVLIIYLQSGDNVELNMKEVPLLTRLSSGKKVIKVPRGDRIINVEER